MELLNRLNTVDSKKKISFKDCIRISRELNLTVEQVILFSALFSISKFQKNRWK